MIHYCKTKLLIIWLLSCLIAFSSCTHGVPISENISMSTLPPANAHHIAPIGDAALEYTAEAALFLPRYDSARLLSITENIAFSPARPPAESLVRALITHAGNGMVAPLAGNIRLALYGVNSVEVSRDVATVNLAASVLQLDRKTFYLACQAITNTLTRLSGINYVNILVMDKQLGLDIEGTLSAGTLSRSVGEDIGAAYEQQLSQRVGFNEQAADKGLVSMATLYFPLPGSNGILPEVRSISFDNQIPEDMVVRLLLELSAGPQQLTSLPTLALLRDLLTEPPSFSTAPEISGNIVTLRFSHMFDDMLDAFQLTRANCLASICYTLSTFIPNLAGIRVYIGDTLVENVPLLVQNSGPLALLFTDGVQYRNDYAAFLLDYCTLYFADENAQKLVEVKRAVPYYQVHNPRALLLELAKGPLSTDNAPNAKPIMPINALEDASLLGFSLNGDTLLVNFAPAFALVGEDLTVQEDRLLAYGLVNTLSAISRIRRVSFFVAGDLPLGFSGGIYWPGDFYKNSGLVH